MAYFMKSPTGPGVWQKHPAQIQIDATLLVQPGQDAEILLWGTGPGGVPLYVVAEHPTIDQSDAGLLNGPYSLGASGRYPLSEDGKPADPNLRRFRMRSTESMARIVRAMVSAGVPGYEYAKAIRVIWSKADPHIGAPTVAPVIVNEPATDSKVFGYINRALLFFGGASEVIRLWGAAKMLGDERNQWIPDGKGGRLGVNCGNRSLAYAEHYLISRAMVAEGGDPKGRRSRYYKAAALVLGYDAGKIANSLLALLTALPNPGFASPIGPPALALRASLKRIYQGGTCPASKPDPDSTQWSLAGCRDGLVEFKDSDLPITHKSPGVSIRVVL